MPIGLREAMPVKNADFLEACVTTGSAQALYSLRQALSVVPLVRLVGCMVASGCGICARQPSELKMLAQGMLSM